MRIDTCELKKGIYFINSKGNMFLLNFPATQDLNNPTLEVGAVELGLESAGVYDEEEIHHNCMVQIWKNSVTGEQSIAWKPEDNDDE